jgi:hypothetical protein
MLPAAITVLILLAFLILLIILIGWLHQRIEILEQWRLEQNIKEQKRQGHPGT